MFAKSVKYKRIRLKDICSFVMGKKLASDAKSDGQYDFYTGSKLVKKTNTFSKIGPAILFSGGGDCAKNVFYVEEKTKFEIASGAICLNTFKQQFVNPAFFYFWLKTNFLEYVNKNGLMTKTTIEHIYIRDVKNAEISIPIDLNYQKAVVDFLKIQISDINKLHEIYGNQLNIAKKLKNSLINELTRNYFGEEFIKMRIKNICVLSSGKKLAGDFKTKGQYDFYTGSQDVKKTDTFSKKGPAILISGGEHACGKNIHFAQPGSKFECTNHAQTLTHFKTNIIDWFFLYFWLKGNLYDFSEKHGFITRTTIPMLNGKNIKNIELSIPVNLSYQKRVSSFLDTKIQQINYFIKLTEVAINQLRSFEHNLIKNLTDR